MAKQTFCVHTVCTWCLQECFWSLSSHPSTGRLLMSLIPREFQPNCWSGSVNRLNLHWSCSVPGPVLSGELSFVPKFHSCLLIRLSQSIVKVSALIVIQLSWCLLCLGHGGAMLSPSAHLPWAQHTNSVLPTSCSACLSRHRFQSEHLNNSPGRTFDQHPPAFFMSWNVSIF